MKTFGFYQRYDVFLTSLPDVVNLKKCRIKPATMATMINPITVAKVTTHLKQPLWPTVERLG